MSHIFDNDKPVTVRAVAKDATSSTPHESTGSSSSSSPSSSDIPKSLADFGPDEGWFVPVSVHALFLGFVPIAEYLARLRLTTHVFNKGLGAFTWAMAGFGFNSSTTTLLSGNAGMGVAADKKVVALGLFYSVVTFVGTAALSITGQTIGRKEGYQNYEPRRGKADLKGMAHRMVAAHQNVLETFPLFALTAALVQFTAPTNDHLIELVALHVFSKTFLYLPAYVLGIDAARSTSHFISIGACLRALTLVALSP
ncbi:hypothetical protein FRC19_010638 [Serendipita sp. 401]|nr:hypothetical protein FRC19_010638 [Serendipita sp. 401]KAG9056260.1 hypothetical protein FS842_011198 [Serendipita sp. 407]